MRMAGIVFGIFCVISVLSAAATGNLASVGAALFSGAEDAVSLMLSLGGAMCLWSGLLEVLREMGVLSVLSRLLTPLLRRLFPSLVGVGAAEDGESDTVLSEITASLSANLLGIGNAATPIGLRAMAHLRRCRTTPDRMSNAEILFTVLNTAPPTVLPTTLLTMRHALGSADPTAVLGAVWIVSGVGCLFAAAVTRGLEAVGTRSGGRRAK